MAVDKLHAVLMLMCGVLAAVSINQASVAEAALSDAERYKRFAVWSLEHADAELAEQAKRSATAQWALEKYLTDDARAKLRDSELLMPLPPLPDDPTARKRFIGGADIRTFEEIQRMRLRAM